MRKPFHSLVKLMGCASAVGVLAGAMLARAQQREPEVPYASIGSTGVTYAGPGRESSYDLRGPVIHIGLLIPLNGPQKADGEAIVTAARMALKDAEQEPSPGGLRVALAMGDESGPAWGRVTDAVLHLVFSDQAVAIITSASGATAHLSEQVGNKIGVPILTLSSDATTTQINLPWIFRLGPTDSQQAQAIAQDIYRARGFRRVLLVSELDHDGRMGGREFIEAASRLGAQRPDSLAINPLKPDAGSLLSAIRSKFPQAIVFWAQPEISGKLLASMRANGIHAPFYLSQEAAQKGSGLRFSPQRVAEAKEPSGAGIYTVALDSERSSLRASFARRYQSATGLLPGPVAAEAYDAVWLIAHAIQVAGPNRARVRDYISRTQDLAGVSGRISFDGQGNNRSGVRLVQLQWNVPISAEAAGVASGGASPSGN